MSQVNWVKSVPRVAIAGLEKVKAEDLQKKWAFNKVASDKISLSRSLSDMRSGQCKALNYVLDNLPTSSVVIIFNNGDSMLL